MAQAKTRAKARPAPAPAVPSGPGPAPDRRLWAFGLVPVALALIAFAPAVGNGFVDWDDFGNFRDNPDFLGLGWPQFRWAWTTSHLGVYQPVSWMLLSAQSAAWGLDPRGYHAVSLLMFAAVVLALYLVTVVLLARARPAFFAEHPGTVHAASALATAVFAAHPLRTEVVAWASGQPYLPCGLFSLLAVLAYLWAHPAEGPDRPGWMAAAFVLGAAAALAKAPAVTLPVVLLILDVYPLRRLGPGRWTGPRALRAYLEKVPYLVLTVALLAAAARARDLATLQMRVGVTQGPLESRLAQAAHAAWFYPIRTLWPAGLSAYYPLDPAMTLRDPRYATEALLLGATTAGLILARRRLPGALAAWATYLAVLAPNSGLTRIGAQVAADRYSFLATMGFVPLLAAGLCRLGPPRVPPRRRDVGVAVLGAGAILALAALSWRQCATWRDSAALWDNALARCENPPPELFNYLGAALNRDRGIGTGDRYIEESLRRARLGLHQDYMGGHTNLGLSLMQQGRIEEATAHLTEAVRLKADDPEARANLGTALLKAGRPGEAEPHLAEAVRLKPGDVDARANLASALLMLGRPDEAGTQLDEVLRRKPDHADTLANLGVLRARQGRWPEAEALLTRATQLRPDRPSLIANLAAVLAEQGQFAEARAVYERALRLDPNLDAARRGLQQVNRRAGGREAAGGGR